MCKHDYQWEENSQHMNDFEYCCMVESISLIDRNDSLFKRGKETITLNF